ncbi:MAG: hypothetical protein DHS20C11_08380 [Lysobacteraceae bacterium]|nr:MAG: hypothetical protein DHS20C11_08380 [Xanthomonadaceae bacterium]
MKQLSESQLPHALRADGPKDRVSIDLHKQVMQRIEQRNAPAFSARWKLIVAGGLSLSLAVAAVIYVQPNEPIRSTRGFASIANVLETAPVAQVSLGIPEQTLKNELVALNADAQKVVAGTPLERLLR